MKSLWNDDEAQGCASLLELRAYSSRLLGRSDDLVLHGGGNTSLKDAVLDVFGDEQRILYVKGSGHDLRTIGAGGFSPTRLAHLLRLVELPSLSDTDMMRELKCALIDPKAPAPSVEAILHALIPHRFVDHTHADAVVTISNTPGGEAKIRALYGDDVLVLPYVMPGFVLARQVYEATRGTDWSRCRGIVLLHHGVFTFADDAKESYEQMIALVSAAEEYLARHAEKPAHLPALRPMSAHEFARLRRAVGEAAGGPVAARFVAHAFAAIDDVAACSRRGPLTPDHVLHTKRIPMLAGGDHTADVVAYAQDYRDYFARNAHDGLDCLDPAPRWAVHPGSGVSAFAVNGKRLQVCMDIVEHTVAAIARASMMGGWQALPERDIFELEYWELEQAKLKSPQKPGEFEGRVVVITGAASGIGLAAAKLFLAQGACVVGIDIDPRVGNVFASPLYLGVVADLIDTAQVRAAFEAAVLHFGGVDILFSNAGIFPVGQRLEASGDDEWSRSMAINLDSHFKVLREAVPYLRVGFAPVVVFNASKNAIAPGPGVGIYSVAKAALTQLARVAALELAGDGVRVNVLHPDAVFDTGIWSDEVLQSRAQKYGLSVEAYKRRNLLAAEIGSDDVARAALALASASFGKSTGMQVTVDGGNERTI